MSKCGIQREYCLSKYYLHSIMLFERLYICCDPLAAPVDLETKCRKRCRNVEKKKKMSNSHALSSQDRHVMVEVLI